MLMLSPRRLIAFGASAAMLSAAVIAAAGVGVAGAVPAFDTPGCSLANSKIVKGSFLEADFTVTKTVDSDGEVAADGRITYTSVVSTTSLLAPNLVSIGDVHPAGFNLVKAEVESWSLVAPLAQKWEDVTKDAVHSGNKVVFGAPLGGWITLGQTVTLKTTYQVPSSVVVGAELNSGAAFKAIGLSGEQVVDPIGVCVKIRAKNAMESAAGSLGGLGLGSSDMDGLGSSGMTGSVSDPGGSVAGSLTGFLGGLLGS